MKDWIRLMGRRLASLGMVAGLLVWAGLLGAIPPLSLDGFRDELLPDAPTEPQADLRANQSCYVCHENMKSDELVIDHAKQRIGCMRCHGESVAHRNDEDNITPPDKMFVAGQIDPMCKECHEHHDVPARKVVKRLHERDVARVDPGKLICISCHYQHRLKVRTVRWNKETGALVIRKVKSPPAKVPGS